MRNVNDHPMRGYRNIPSRKTTRFPLRLRNWRIMGGSNLTDSWFLVRNSPFNVDSTLPHPFFISSWPGRGVWGQNSTWQQIQNRSDLEFYTDPRLGDKNIHENAFNIVFWPHGIWVLDYTNWQSYRQYVK